jgi:integrase
VKQCFKNLNRVLGNRIVATIRPVDLENYQDKREEQGRAPATIDMELTCAKAMVSKAFDNDMSGHTLKVFRGFKRKLRKGVNVRRRTLSFQEYTKLVAMAPPHLQTMTIVAYNTGMRTGELRKLQWKHIDRKKGFIHLEADVTKEGRAKSIPMNRNVLRVFEGLPHALHHDFVFTYNGKPIVDPGGLKRSFKKACEKAGIPCGMKNPGD